MPREAKPWFNRQTGWWCTDIAGRRYKLVRGKPGDERRKTPPQPAWDAFQSLMQQCAVNPPAGSGPAVVTVPSIIDEYLDVGCRGNEPATFEEKRRLLQSFARDHRECLAVELKPYDLEKWQRFPERRKRLQDNDLRVHYFVKKSLAWCTPNMRP